MKILLFVVSIWLVGFAVSVARFILLYRRAAKEIQTYPLSEDETCKRVLRGIAAEVSGGRKPIQVRIRRGESVPVPMGFGIFRKYILLPKEAYSEQELYYILRHEYTHFQNGDIGRKIFLQMLGAFFWWVPGILPLKRDLEQAIEIKCDLDVTRGMANPERAEYLKVIVAILKNSFAREKQAGSKWIGRKGISGRAEADITERFQMVSADFRMSREPVRLWNVWLRLCERRIKTLVHTSVTLKALLRSPLKTTLTFSLLAAASFALFSRVTDYAVTSREVKNAENYYHGVAALDTSVPDITVKINSVSEGYVPVLYTYTPDNRPWPTEEKLREFASLPGAMLADTRYMTAGLAEDYERLSEYENPKRMIDFVLECTYAGYENSPEDTDGNSYIDLKLDNVRVLACEEELETGKTVVMKRTPLGDNPYFQTSCPRSFYDEMETGTRILVWGYFFGSAPKNERGQNLSLCYGKGEDAFYIFDRDMSGGSETEIPAKWQKIIEGVRQDRFIYDIVYTSDIRAIPCYNERNMVISQGRPLTAEDEKVCVVNENFLKKYGLAVGDTLSVKLGDKLHSQRSVTEGARNSLKGDRMEVAAEAELEIVGAYHINIVPGSGNYEEEIWYYTPNTIFVPRSLLPVEVPEDHEFMPGEYSVFVENARDIERFRDAAEVWAAEMDLGLRFSDGGWMSVKESFEVGAITSLLTTAAYLLGGAAALLLAVYLYVGRSKKSYAILRMLGVPGMVAGNSLAFPFVVLSILAIPVGGLAGLFYAGNTAERTLADMIETAPAGYIPNVELPAGAVLACLILESAFIAAAILGFLRKMQKKPPLELLQEDTLPARSVKKKARENAATASSPYTGLDPSKITAGLRLPSERRYTALRQVFSYVLRHMRRGVGKTAISLLLTIVLTAGIGALVLTEHAFAEAFERLEVQGRALEFSSDSLARLAVSPLIKDMYCYGGFSVQLDADTDERLTDTENGGVFGSGAVPLTVTNDPQKYLGENAAIAYREGCDISDFDSGEQVCFIGRELADTLRVAPGYMIRMISGHLYAAMGSDSNVREDAVEQMYKSYKVIAVVSADAPEINCGVMIGIKGDPGRLYGQPFPVSYCEFVLADNDKSGELNDLLQREYSQSAKYTSQAGFHLDLEALHNIGRIRAVLGSLFPIAVTAAVLIGLSASLLLILQSSLEAALLRALGVTKKRARCMLVLEQTLLCAVGMLLVAVGLLLADLKLPAADMRILILCFALYGFGCFCGAAAAAVQVTKNKIMELLQGGE